MCIIAIKNKGIEFPTDKEIKTMWTHNPDGCGMMWAENGQVHIRKGFMTLESFYAFLGEWKKTHDLTKTAVVFHFRITTHGGTNPECTHPFPISNQEAPLRKLSFDTDLGVVHNGIIPITPRNSKTSDTMEYILSQLSVIKKINRKFYKEKRYRELIQNAISSKMAFLTADGEVYTIGDFNTDKDTGMVYSNYSWQSYSYLGVYKSYSNYDDYDWDKILSKTKFGKDDDFDAFEDAFDYDGHYSPESNSDFGFENSYFCYIDETLVKFLISKRSLFSPEDWNYDEEPLLFGLDGRVYFLNEYGFAELLEGVDVYYKNGDKFEFDYDNAYDLYVEDLY